MMPQSVAESPQGPGIAPALYLLPSTMTADGRVSDVLPQRDIDIARQVKHFVVENERTTRRFLKRLDPTIDINSLSFTLLNEHTPAEDIPAMLAPLERGEAMAVVSEAGCPAVADPGAELAAAAQRRGLKVVPLVGPSSMLLALMASGFNGQSWAFDGYLPVEPKARAARLHELHRRIERERQTQIFIETPYRNDRLLADLIATLPPSMLLCVAIDLTGPNESIITRPLAQWRKAREKGEALPKTPAIFLLYSS
ncbi:MAG: SAM-dependent methyltransferase [Pseudoflavonifractor sp.]|nr:SAM-dependent methyltransferase [Alloprevotella sp.]MCM1117402.1 SAM-dependent methyltransferase [Pseudoflavonifractor sp.]